MQCDLPGSGEAFKAANLAYETLTDPVKRDMWAFVFCFFHKNVNVKRKRYIDLLERSGPCRPDMDQVFSDSSQFNHEEESDEPVSPPLVCFVVLLCDSTLEIVFLCRLCWGFFSYSLLRRVFGSGKVSREKLQDRSPNPEGRSISFSSPLCLRG